MRKWEYKSFLSSVVDPIEELNLFFGDEGWELVAVEKGSLGLHTFIFKREKDEPVKKDEPK
jgi:hypothetical protein